MTLQPTINTERLTLRPFNPADAPEVQRLAGDRSIADTTLNIPHPYEDGIAESWIAKHQESFTTGKAVIFAVVLRESGQLVGAVGITRKEHDRGEMGYWMGKPFWNQGYTTEAAKAMIAFGFEHMDLNKVSATHLARNPASGRVMEKAGMTFEGYSAQHVKKWGIYEDMKFFGILREEFEKERKVT